VDTRRSAVDQLNTARATATSVYATENAAEDDTSNYQDVAMVTSVAGHSTPANNTGTAAATGRAASTRRGHTTQDASGHECVANQETCVARTASGA